MQTLDMLSFKRSYFKSMIYYIIYFSVHIKFELFPYFHCDPTSVSQIFCRRKYQKYFSEDYDAIVKLNF